MELHTSQSAVSHSPSGFTRRFRLVLLALTLGVLSWPAFAAHPYERWAEELGIDLDVSYDGTRIMEIRGGTYQAIERRAPEKMYTEINTGNMSSAIILREDLQKSYLLMPTMGFYKEETLEGGLMQASNDLEFSNIEELGNEVVLGFPSTKYQTEFKDKDGTGSGFVWVTDSGVPIKMEMIYSNDEFKGERINIYFTELNLREQDPAIFEVPANLKPMNMGDLGSIMQQDGAQAAPSAASAGTDADLSARQQACLEQSANQAQKQKNAEKKKGFGNLMGAVARTANRFGVGNMNAVTRDVYNANATADDVATVAGELGITTDDVERCRNP